MSADLVIRCATAALIGVCAMSVYSFTIPPGKRNWEHDLCALLLAPAVMFVVLRITAP